MIKGVGGLATLAHPRELRAAGGLEDLLSLLKAAGLAGMEVYYQDYVPEEVEFFRRLAEKFGLLPLGGSDYHGLGDLNNGNPETYPCRRNPLTACWRLPENRACSNGPRSSTCSLAD